MHYDAKHVLHNRHFPNSPFLSGPVMLVFIQPIAHTQRVPSNARVPGCAHAEDPSITGPHSASESAKGQPLGVWFLEVQSLYNGLQSLAPNPAHRLPPPAQVYELEGVVQLQDIHVWTLCSGVYHGSLRVEVLAGTDHRRLLIAARSILIQVQPRPPACLSLSEITAADLPTGWN